MIVQGTEIVVECTWWGVKGGITKHPSLTLSKEAPEKLTDPNPELNGCGHATVRLMWFRQLLIKEVSHASNVALLIHVWMSRICETPEASFAITSFHLSTNCVRNRKLKLGGSLPKEDALEDPGGLHAPYLRPRENTASTLSPHWGQKQGSTPSSAVCEHPLRPTPGLYQKELRQTRDR
jgi:hypothetical protein